MKTLLLIILICSGAALRLPAQEPWQEALRKMPISPGTNVNRDNALPIILTAFKSNNLVRGVVFLPAVSDDFYLVSRALPKLNIQADDLLAAISALTNKTGLRVTFRAPLLLLHLERDRLEPSLVIKHKATAERLKQQSSLPRAIIADMHWRGLQPLLQDGLKLKVTPTPESPEAWHFARHNMAAWGLADWDLLAALSLTGKTTIAIQRNRAVFSLRDPPWKKLLYPGSI